MHLQHHNLRDISSTTHIHVDEHICLDVPIVRGKSKDVRRLANNIIAVKGVKHGGLVITKTAF